MVGRFFILLIAIAIASCSSEDEDVSSVPEEEFPESSSSSLIVEYSSFSSSAEDIPVNSSSSVTVLNVLRSELVKMASKGSTVVLGTNQSSAKKKEQPQMSVAFSYDFMIGRHEVTCGEYNSLIDLMNSGSGKMARLDCVNDSLPASNMTFYDAVLLANARSRQEGRDTSYVYGATVYDDGGHCVGLDKLEFRPEVEAYRLPTESEWMFAAQYNWNPQFGWTSENSEYRVHSVCSSLGVPIENVPQLLCDMAGNVMEWTNDWLGSFRDTTVVNYVGASDGGGLGERVLKGGCYRNAAASMAAFSRGDVYTVTSSTRADYVGFRLAFGAIPNAVWMAKDEKQNSIPVTPVANSLTLQNLTGVYEVKLVFRNDQTGNLAYIDYFDGSKVTVVEILDTIDSYHPEISPDGKKVAFCTKPEGVGGKSELYVRNLSASGSNLVKLDVESAAIPRWKVTPQGDTVIIYVTDAGNNKNDAEFLTHGTWQVPFSNGQFGIPTKLFDGNYHGGVSDDGMLAVTGARLLRAHVTGPESATDVVWYNGEQACNASLSKDGTKRTLFLDFGGTTGQAFVGHRYGTHEQLLVADAAGNIVQMVPAPPGYTFDHSEWTSSGYTQVSPSGLAVASLANLEGAHEKLVLINLSDGLLTELVEGEELWHPNLWAGSASGPTLSLLALDSAGVYLLPFYSKEAAVYRLKMELFWKNINTSQVLVYGSSRVEQGIDPDVCPHRKMLNLGAMGIDVNRELYFINNYAMNHSGNLKAIAMSLDFDNWRPSGGILNNLIFYPGYIYDRNHGFWKDGIPPELLEMVEYSYAPSAEIRQSYSKSGAGLLASGSWDKDGLEVLEDSMVTQERMDYINAAVAEIFRLAEECAQRQIHFIGIVFPQAPKYSETGSFGLYGIQRSVAERIIERFDSLAAVNPYFHFMDENKMGLHDYVDEDAANRDHLSVSGARKLTRRLDSLLNAIELIQKE